MTPASEVRPHRSSSEGPGADGPPGDALTIRAGFGHWRGVPIYEFACPQCRKIFNFLSRRVNPASGPKCPQCGSRKLSKEISRFAMIKGVADPAEALADSDEDAAMPDLSDPRVARAMSEMERDMDHLDENNPRHMAHMLRKMKEVMPEGTMPKEFDIAIRRLEAGEDPEKIEAEMGDVLNGALSPGGGERGGGSHGTPYSRDPGLYDYE